MKHSVIVTGYNCEKYLDECIESILEQTHPAHEIMIYNDGSTDRTAELLLKYGHYPNIWIWNMPFNKGALHGRYEYVKLATGDVISFVGMDDALDPNALEVLNRYYTDDIMLSYGSWQDMRTGKKSIARPYPDEVFKKKNFRRSGWRATALNTFRTELIQKVPKELLMIDGKLMDNCTDLAYSFPCLENVTKDQVAVVKEPIYLYRSSHPNTTMKRLGKQHKTVIREKLKRMPICKL